MCKHTVRLFAILFLTWMPTMAFSQFLCDCKAQSWREFDKSAPTNSGETKAERKQEYCDAAVRGLQACWINIYQQQTNVVKDIPKENRQKDKCKAKIDRKIAKIRKKYCSAASS